MNKILAAHKKKGNHPIQYKIGPDPSSIDSCMVGGMVSNNSSGMCCGVSQNTYHTLKDMRVVFVDGTVLDTADPASRESFLKASTASPAFALHVELKSKLCGDFCRLHVNCMHTVHANSYRHICHSSFH